jgi:hypothetical protein
MSMPTPSMWLNTNCTACSNDTTSQALSLMA